MNYTLYLFIVGSVNYVIDVYELVLIFSLNFSKCSFFYKERVVVLSLSYNKVSNVWFF